jgi:hypothetical protein
VSVVARPARAVEQAPGDRFGARAEVALMLAALVGAVAVWALTRSYPNYDSYYHLVWGRELLDGLVPTFQAYAAPTQHPLWVAVAAVLGLIGEPADRALVLLCLIAHAALVIGTYRLGAAVFGRWTGLLGAAFVTASASFALYALRGYVDTPFLALVVWAGALSAHPRRAGGHATPLTLLVLAGLLRPEAWILTGLYALRAWRADARARTRAALAAATLAAPLVWSAVDLLSTGDPLHSLNATSELAGELGRERGLANVPGAFVVFLAATVRPPVALLALAGLWLAVRRLGWQRTSVPLALLGAGVATFVGTGALGLSILPRYLTVPAVALCLFAGYALAGFTRLDPADPLRARWRLASTLAAAVAVAGLIALAPSPRPVLAELEFLRATHDDLVAVLDDPEVRAARACGPVTLPNYRLVPDTRWHLDADRTEVGARSALRRKHGVALFAVGEKPLRRIGFADGASPSTNVPDPGFRPIARHGSLVAYAACP